MTGTVETEPGNQQPGRRLRPPRAGAGNNPHPSRGAAKSQASSARIGRQSSGARDTERSPAGAGAAARHMSPSG
ncbi:hypothetical protein JCM18897A_41620 [Streptomyces sp. JCM 18897]